MSFLRFIFDPPASGAWNMAVDEAILHESVGSQQPTLRFYSWETPTLSLGHFQSAADRERHPASRDCPLVRRASGGGAILHDRELTYSLVFPQAASSQAALNLYEQVHRTLIAALASLGVHSALYRDTARCDPGGASAGSASLGCADSVQRLRANDPFLCFQRRTCFDVVCEGEKIAGSAQRRRRGAVLQHGSVLLARSPYAPELPGAQDLAGADISTALLAKTWLPLLAGEFERPAQEGGLGKAELAIVKELVRDRFGSPEHSLRR